MSLISYAQNLEDIMLWRALKDHHIQKGFYIDVGAWLANQDSVTCLFYEKGWRGINVEPLPVYYRDLLEKRPEDINLSFIVSDQESLSELYTLEDSKLSISQKTLVNELEKQELPIKKKSQPAINLAKLWEKYVPFGQEVHFLKVGVEENKLSVLKGNDWSKYQPWIVIVESIDPLTRQENYLEWESILLSANYTFAYADGLNRFYIAPTHLNLLQHFKYPPNVFDGFVIYNHLRPLLLQVERQEAQINNMCEKLNAVDKIELNTFFALKTQYNELLNSTSWRITAPLRYLKRKLSHYAHRLKKRSIVSA